MHVNVYRSVPVVTPVAWSHASTSRLRPGSRKVVQHLQGGIGARRKVHREQSARRPLQQFFGKQVDEELDDLERPTRLHRHVQRNQSGVGSFSPGNAGACGQGNFTRSSDPKSGGKMQRKGAVAVLLLKGLLPRGTGSSPFLTAQCSRSHLSLLVLDLRRRLPLCPGGTGPGPTAPTQAAATVQRRRPAVDRGFPQGRHPLLGDAHMPASSASPRPRPRPRQEAAPCRPFLERDLGRSQRKRRMSRSDRSSLMATITSLGMAAFLGIASVTPAAKESTCSGSDRRVSKRSDGRRSCSVISGHCPRGAKCPRLDSIDRTGRHGSWRNGFLHRLTNP